MLILHQKLITSFCGHLSLYVKDKNTKRNVFAGLKPEDTKCLRVLFHKRKHDFEFVVSTIKAFKASLCSFEKIIHTSASLKSLYH